MVELLEGRILSRHLLEKYSKNPAGWSFTVFPGNRAENGFGALIGSRDEMWRIQLDSIYSAKPLMLGAKADVDADSIPRPGNVSYGYRKLSRKALLAILGDLGRESTADSKPSEHDVMDYVDPHSSLATGRPTLDRILAGLEPVSPKTDGAYAEGPIVFTTRKGVEPIIDRQKELEDKLSAELKRLLKNRYSAYG
jgi:hypothetical protein